MATHSSPFSGSSWIRDIVSFFTLLNNSSTVSSCSITSCAIIRFCLIKDCMLLLTILIVAFAILSRCVFSLIVRTSASFLTIPVISHAWSPIRSISDTIFIAADITRRSLATGCCCIRSFIQIRSISLSFWLISSSIVTISSISSLSLVATILAAAVIISSHKEPMSIISWFNLSSCLSNRFLI